MKRIGVAGTMVWDTIHGRGDLATPVEEWGGIAYALGALEAGLPEEWEIVPLIKVGRDFAGRANTFLRSLTHRSGATRFLEVPEPNNRVTLRYVTGSRRSEQMKGGVPGWSWSELGPLVRDLDALYINFISGYEMGLETAQLLRRGFNGPIYCDLHSLLFGITSDGYREPRRLPEIASWFACFDAVQLNEDEMKLIGSDPIEVAATALNAGVRLLVVTLGERGAAYFTARPFNFLDRSTGDVHQIGPIETARVATEPNPAGDPTGCGDVFGAVLTAELLQSTDLEEAIRSANRAAGRNLSHRGATNLHQHLRGEISPA